jgi:hypothetical protein
MQPSLVETGTSINPEIPRSIKIYLIARSVFTLMSVYFITKTAESLIALKCKNLRLELNLSRKFFKNRDVMKIADNVR